MAIQIDGKLLTELGLGGLSKADEDKLIAQIYETLETRVGMKLAAKMNDEQLDAFEELIEANDQAGAMKWLETNYPNYREVVHEELAKLKGEVQKDAPRIRESIESQPGAQASA